MTGQRIDDVTGCVVLAQDATGRQTGWHVFQVREMSWQMNGVGPNGTEATVTISGAFHRMDRNEMNNALEMAPQQIEEST